MKSKFLIVVTAFMMALSFATPPSYAVGAKQATASLLLPTTGQAMNDEIGAKKTKIMAGIEVAAIATIAILGTAVGGGVVWAGLGPLIANHAWSSVDAYHGANAKQASLMNSQAQLQSAQQTLDFSRQRRFEREETMRSSIRDRVNQAGEQAYMGK